MWPRLVAMMLPAVALATLLGPARAAVTEAEVRMETAGDLVDLCTVRENDPLATAAGNFCQGFVLGVYQTLSEAQTAMPRKLFCVPAPAPTRNQAIGAFLTWVSANPTVKSERPADAVLRYLAQRYPCAAR